jgi:GNAT superfamily N-acetyltransferase
LAINADTQEIEPETLTENNCNDAGQVDPLLDQVPGSPRAVYGDGAYDKWKVYVRQFFVRPERRRQGIGRAAWAWLRANPWREAPRICLDVLIGNGSGIQFWRSLGFEDYCITMEQPNQP